MRPTEGFTGVTVATSGHGSSQVGIDYLSDKGLTGYGQRPYIRETMHSALNL